MYEGDVEALVHEVLHEDDGVGRVNFSLYLCCHA